MTGTFHVSRETLGELGEALVVIRAACASVAAKEMRSKVKRMDYCNSSSNGLEIVRRANRASMST